MSNPNEILDVAARAMREAPLHGDVLRRAEAAILPRVARTTVLRPLMLGAGGLAAALVGTAIFALPSRASAADILRIAAHGDRDLRHIRFYVAGPTGTLRLTRETYAENGRRRFRDEYGNEFLYDGRIVTMLHPDGEATTEARRPGRLPLDEGSARDLLTVNAQGWNARISVRRVLVDGRILNRYSVERDLVDARGDTLHNAFILDVDPAKDRPLSMRSRMTGFPESVTTWDYPAPSPANFRLPIASDAPVYNLDAQRAEVLRSLRAPGRAITIGGKTVELLGLWVDGQGQAAAVARADYSYPYDYGLQIDGTRSLDRPKAPPFSGRYAAMSPTAFEGSATQLFRLNRLPNAGALRYSDRVNLRIPVFEDKRLLGYARFDGVPVHRTHSVPFFMEPANVPFWSESSSGDGIGASAVEATL